MPRALAISLSFAVVLGASATAGVSAAPPRRGKIVRLERPHLIDKHRIRLCVQTQAQQDRLLCIGSPPPRAGTELHLLDFNGPYLGTGRIVRSTASTQMGCRSEQVSDVYYTSSITRAPSILVAIMGIAMSERTTVTLNARVAMPANARAGENQWLAFDLDGKGEIDLLLTMRKCEDNRPAGSSGVGQCLAFWVREGVGWRLHNEDAIYNCN